MIDHSEIKVSVIIPVYNAKAYLHDSVKSVLSQTHSNVEVILVDDCSTDGTWDVEEKLAEENENVILVKNEQNSGQTLSRNHGMKCITGDWFMFLDADDELAGDSIEQMLAAGLEGNADMVMCDYQNIFADGRTVDNTTSISSGIFDAKEFCKHIFSEIPLNVYSCVGTKLYRASFLEKKRPTPDFPRTGGDFMFITDSLMADPKVYYLKKALYKYYVRKGSISNSYRPNMYSDMTKTRAGLWELFEKFGIKEDRKLELSKLRYEIIYMALSQETFKNRSYSDYLNTYNMIFRETESLEAIGYLIKHSSSFPKRMYIRMFRHPFVLYGIIKLRLALTQRR